MTSRGTVPSRRYSEMMSAADTRTRILDALETVLLDGGPSAITLDAVASGAGVSKGGLLYHFRSKEALLAGLIQRLVEASEQAFADAERDGLGAAAFYLQTATPQGRDAALYRSVLALLRSADGSSAEADTVLRQALAGWSARLHAQIGDPVLAETIRLVADGMLLSSLIGLQTPDPALYGQVVQQLLNRARRGRRARRVKHLANPG